ncbi:MAG: hypothetical protein K5696_02610 [Lachnospiraceae bacterium]|nr:hypothetical protein [Lachnospiraceae bacterium]
MLQVLLVILYMGVTTWILGFGVLSSLTAGKLFAAVLRIPAQGIRPDRTDAAPYRIRHRLSYLLAGVVCATVYAEIFSLFAPVGAAAQLLLVLICILIVYHYRTELFHRLLVRAGFSGLQEVRGRMPDGYLLSRRIWLIYALLVLWIAYGASHGVMHYDTGLYHAQSIRWIEEFGTVPGIANLHSRLGYNSASFAFSALYSFSFLKGAPVHAGAGYFALLLSFACLDIIHILRRGRPVLTDFIRFAGLWYLFGIYREMVSPAPDYFLNCFLFCVLILWTDLDVSHERHFLPYALLAVGVCYAVTVKLSAGGLLVLCIRPIVMIFREAARRAGQGKHAFRGVRKKPFLRRAFAVTGAFAAMVLLIVAPYMLRNFLISGWPLYPSLAGGFWQVPWQVPHDLAEGDAAGIRAYARGTLQTAFGQWFPSWLASQSFVSRALIVADLCSAAGYVICILVFALVPAGRRDGRPGGRPVRDAKRGAKIQRISRYDLQNSRDFLFLEGALLISFFFWFLQAPLLRFGFFFVWTPPLLMGGRLLLLLMHRLSDAGVQRIAVWCSVFLAVFLLYKGVRLVAADTSVMRVPYLFGQQEYERFEVVPYEVDGTVFYYPAEGDRTGYDGFPGGDHRAGIRLLGDSLREGICFDPLSRS